MKKSEMLQALIARYAGGKKSEFARLLSISSNTLTNWIARNTFDAERIFAYCKDVNPAWLLNGEGEMINASSSAEQIFFGIPVPEEGCEEVDMSGGDTSEKDEKKLPFPHGMQVKRISWTRQVQNTA